MQHNSLLIMWLIFLAVAAGVYLYAVNFKKRLASKGLEAEAAVLRVETDTDGWYHHFVSYVDSRGEKQEASFKSKEFIPEGSVVKIKYLPEKPDYVLLLK